jgi:PAS domain S-box-containing protein
MQRLWRALFAWDPLQLTAWQRYGVAITLTVAATWLRMSLAPAESGGRFITFSLAAALSALYGGFRAGLLSTVLGMVLANFFLVRPFFSPAIDNLSEALWLNLWHFITQLVVVGAIAQMQQRNQRLQVATQEVQASQRHFLETFEHAAAGISHVGAEGQLLRVNRSFCDLVGYSADELQHLRFQDITHPDDIEPDIALLRETLAGLRSRYTLEKRYRHKQGHWVWVQLTVALVRKADGRPDYFVSVVQDLTTLKASEEALRTSERLMQQAQNLAGFASWEADLSNWRFRALGGSHVRLGLASAEFGGGELMALTHPDDQERLWAEWVAALQGVSEYNSVYRATIGGQDRWFSVRAEFERDSSGRVLRAYGVTQDITQQTLAEQEIRRLNASLELRIQERTLELKEAYDELESYSYAVAHDLRSPLRIINGFAQALQEDNPQLGEGSRVHLRRIMGASAKMGHLIDGLLQLSQYARGEVHRHPVNLSAVATRLLEDLSADDPARTVQWQVAPDLLAQADPPLVEALLQNLLHNAWKYTAHTPQAQIRVYGETVNGQTRYCIADNGAGFDMSRSGKLFQPFQRLHQPGEFEGLGIGLATARRIVQRHGGQLSAQAAPGQGATFGFTLAPPPGSSRPPAP